MMNMLMSGEVEDDFCCHSSGGDGAGGETGREYVRVQRPGLMVLLSSSEAEG